MYDDILAERGITNITSVDLIHWFGREKLNKYTVQYYLDRLHNIYLDMVTLSDYGVIDMSDILARFTLGIRSRRKVYVTREALEECSSINEIPDVGISHAKFLLMKLRFRHVGTFLVSCTGSHWVFRKQRGRPTWL